MISIEFEEPTESTCECCGNVTVRLTRFVYRDGDAHAVYYAQYTAGYDEKRLSGLLGLGEWGEARTPDKGVAFRIWTDEKDFKLGLVNAADSPWSHVTSLGRILDREEALKH